MCCASFSISGRALNVRKPGMRWMMPALASMLGAQLLFGQAARAPGEQRDAKELWEQAITAKGGRERLQGVRNVVISFIHKYRKWFLPRRETGERLYVFPGQIWGYSDQRPAIFGVRISVYDIGRELWYTVPADHTGPRVMETPEEWKRTVRTEQARFLMETSWLKPVPVRAREGKLRGKPVDVLELKADSDTFTYYLDPKTKLALMLAHRYASDRMPGKDSGDDYYFYDYRPVDGIMMPQSEGYVLRVRGRGEYRSDLRFQFNVDYDPEIFDRAPRIEDGPQGWKRKK
jgi:hypothetical protein